MDITLYFTHKAHCKVSSITSQAKKFSFAVSMLIHEIAIADRDILITGNSPFSKLKKDLIVCLPLTREKRYSY